MGSTAADSASKEAGKASKTGAKGSGDAASVSSASSSAKDSAKAVAAAAQAAAQAQILPQKEGNVFKTIVKFYETKQYKKGLKAADSILKRFPEHGETLAMKGLTLNCMDKKKEAYELVRLGLKKNMASHVCWHVYGLLYRSDRDYKEAIKCYKQALKRDKDNTQILRDLSLLQIQMRELSGFAETRRQLLTLNAKNRYNWIGFAIATHVAGDLPMALNILQSYESTIEEVRTPDYEHGEMLLYKNKIIEEMGDTQKTLDHLVQSEPLVLDRLSLREKKSELLIKLGRLSEAEAVLRELLKINSENYAYHKGLLLAKGLDTGKTLSESDQETLIQLYADLQQHISKSNALKRFPLDFLSGERFRKHFTDYVKPPLRKGVPSLFTDLKPLYKDSEKVQIMEEVMLGFAESLRKDQVLPASNGQATVCEVPVTLLWVLVYLAQHFDKKREHVKGLELIEEAIRYTPTVIDLYSTRARICKHAGDIQRASDECEVGRKMDLADRFLNTMSTRYALLADRRTLADSTVTLFTKDADNPNNLFDMQCMWYEIDFGNSCLRTKHYGKALKKFMAVDKHFTDIIEDQFDFHTYCLRKMTLRAYMNLLRCEDTIYKHKFFVQAAIGIVRCYMALHDAPPKAPVEEVDEEMQGLNEAEKKKLLIKRRKAERKAAEEAEAEEEARKKGKADDKKKGKNIKEDEDPDGEKLVQVESPIEETTRFITLLQEHAGGKLETHLLSMEVYLRKAKYLKVLQAVKRAAQLTSQDEPELHRCVVLFLSKLEEVRAQLSPAVSKVINMELEESKQWGMEGLGRSAKDYNEVFIAQHGGKGLMHAFAAAQALVHMDGANTKRAGELIVAAPVQGLKLKNLETVHRWMKSVDCEKAMTDEIERKSLHLYPLSTYFKQ